MPVDKKIEKISQSYKRTDVPVVKLFLNNATTDEQHTIHFTKLVDYTECFDNIKGYWISFTLAVFNPEECELMKKWWTNYGIIITEELTNIHTGKKETFTRELYDFNVLSMNYDIMRDQDECYLSITLEKRPYPVEPPIIKGDQK